MTWDDYFMGIAVAVSAKSKDPSTRIGAVVVGPDHEILSTGYNGFPRRVQELECRMARPDKYLYTAHAEANAIFQAARHGIRLSGATMYVTGAPCAECAKAMIQAGIVRVVHAPSDDGMAMRWRDSCNAAHTMFREAGVEVTVALRTEDVYG